MKKTTCIIVLSLVFTLTACSSQTTTIQDIDSEKQTLSEDVFLDVTMNENNGKPSFVIETNLPDEMSLMLSISGENNYRGASTLHIDDGLGQSEKFSSSGNHLDGAYTLEIKTALPSIMSEDIQKVIGSNGELMTGEFIHNFEDNLEKRVAASFDFTIDKNSNEAKELTPYFDPHIFEIDKEAIAEDQAEEQAVADETETTVGALTFEEKMEILTFINSRIDPLHETNMSVADIEAKAEEVWLEAQEKFDITEMVIMYLMLDTDLTKEYYEHPRKVDAK